jgi:ubiquinone/menaquinone biosynthesis C-methylase UbiE
MSIESQDVVADEVALLREWVPLAGSRLAELGCGKAEFARKLVEQTPVESLVAFEVDEIQHRLNLEGPRIPKLEFRVGGAEEIPLPDASVDGVLMMKSLHHVPIPLLDRALQEVRRVLKPQGWLYVSEPVFDGEFNDIVKLFHDERVVRQEAYAAMRRAADTGLLEMVLEKEFVAPIVFRDYDDFVEKLVRATHTAHSYPADVAAQVRARFSRHEGPSGARFLRPMRVNLLRRSA